MPPVQPRVYRYYDLLISVFVVVLLISNLVGQKTCAFGPFHIFGWSYRLNASGAQLLFPIAYIFGDIFTEVYGLQRGAARDLDRVLRLRVNARTGSHRGRAASRSTVAQPAGVRHRFRHSSATGYANLIAFWCGEFANSFVLAKMKLLTKGRYLWTRTVGSTAVGQAVDAAVLMVVAFAGTLHPSVIVNLIIDGYLFKVIYEVLARQRPTPS